MLLLAALSNLIRRYPACWLWLVGGIWLLVYVLLAWGSISFLRVPPPQLLMHGAAYAPALAAGEYWRLLAAPWLHGTLVHALYSAAMLVLLGSLALRSLGLGLSIAGFVAGLAAGFGASLLVHGDQYLMVGGDQYLMVGGWGGLSTLAGMLLAVSFRQPQPRALAGIACLHLLLITLHALFVRQLAQIGLLPQLGCFLLGVVLVHILLDWRLARRGVANARWAAAAFLAGLPLFAALEQVPESRRWPVEITGFEALYRFEASLLAANIRIGDMEEISKRSQEAILALDIPVMQKEADALAALVREMPAGRVHDRLAAAQGIAQVLIASALIYRFTGPHVTPERRKLWYNMAENRRVARNRYLATYLLGM